MQKNKTVVISNTKGKDIRSLYDNAIYNYNDDFSNLVFLGSFFDSFSSIDPDLQFKRFIDMFEIQKCDSRVHIVIGESEAKLLIGENLGFKSDVAEKCKIFLLDNLNRLEYVFEDEKYIYSSHLISQDFLQSFKLDLKNTNDLNKALVLKEFSMFTSTDGLLNKKSESSDCDYLYTIFKKKCVASETKESMQNDTVISLRKKICIQMFA